MIRLCASSLWERGMELIILCGIVTAAVLLAEIRELHTRMARDLETAKLRPVEKVLPPLRSGPGDRFDDWYDDAA